MKDTAVDWLYKNLLDNPTSNQDVIYNINVFEKAKEMEKEQIKDSFDTGNRIGYDEHKLSAYFNLDEDNYKNNYLKQ